MHAEERVVSDPKRRECSVQVLDALRVELYPDVAVTGNKTALRVDTLEAMFARHHDRWQGSVRLAGEQLKEVAVKRHTDGEGIGPLFWPTARDVMVGLEIAGVMPARHEPVPVLCD